MEARYEPSTAEQPTFQRWEAAGVFGGVPESGRDPFVIALPLPNVTGDLHMGHALNGSYQDTLIRLRRMQGRDSLWICGTDHASIAVHAVIEKQLRAEGLTRWDLGRERFLERVSRWREETGATIIRQFKRLGCSLDYEHERFTMDAGYVDAVLTMFVELYGKGYIYRDNRMINWCPTCASTISDLEVRFEHAVDTLYEVRYRIAGTDDFLTVATVRPETILADTAVAVHPDDERYTHLVGRTAIVPLVEREVPIIADDYVKMDFGTGALKVTPGHDPNDFEIGRRHGLAELAAIGFDGHMTELAGEFAGLPVAEARDRVRDALFAQGLLRKEQPYEHEVGHCDRSGDRIEPLISLQWFMQMDELAKPANEAVRSGRVRFHPKNQENIYYDWMLNLRPWCISRQLWWGHQIPVWYCPDGHQTAARSEPEACAECGSRELERDPDVLDTWFSSALWPYATLGWPDDTPSLRRWYPGNVLSTARDIINLWVARMIFTGMEFAGDIPFTDVYIHSTIQAPDGRRMSKSLGTGIDPLDLVDRYGADATRYGLLKMSSTQDVRFAEGMLDEGRAFTNKLWNASRLVLLGADPEALPAPTGTEPIDRWILTRLNEVTRTVTEQFETFQFANLVKELYGFVWNDVCDWYLEGLKIRLYGDDPEVKRTASETALFVLERVLALLHPVMPFVTEEIWPFLPGERGLLMQSSFPVADGPEDPEAARAVSGVIELVTELRRMRQDAGLGPREPLEVAISGGADADHLRAQADLLSGLGRAVIVADTVGGVPVVVGDARALVGGGALAVALRGKLERRLADARGDWAKAQAKLANAGFVDRAPAAVVAEEREREARLQREVEALEARLAELQG